MICIRCKEDKDEKKFGLSTTKGKTYGRKKTCNKCYYDKNCRGIKYGKRFKWATATDEEKKQRVLKNFEKNTKRDGECLIWTKCLSKKGYPGIFFNGRFALASRACWTVYNGPIPKGMCVLHRCDRPECVEISHLFLGTQKDNWHDMFNKGRKTVRKGSECSWSKLDEEKVREIKKRLKSGESPTRIAYENNVSYGSICDIKRGRNWKHVSMD